MKKLARQLVIPAFFCFLFLCSASGWASVICVSTSGDDANSGASWEQAKKSVQAGVNAASDGDEIWVAAGTYVECLNILNSVSLYGGFKGNETEREQRDWKANETMIVGELSSTTITIGSTLSIPTCLDGFTIKNNSLTNATGVRCVGDTTVISNNVFTGYSGRGILCSACSSLTITHNVITLSNSMGVSVLNSKQAVISDNTISNRAGISCNNSSVTMSENTITSTDFGISLSSNANTVISKNMINISKGVGIIISWGTSSVVISGNKISGGQAGISGIFGDKIEITNNEISNSQSGIQFSRGPNSLIISNNTITHNTSTNSMYKGGIYYQTLSDDPLLYQCTISNNTISDNSSDSNGGGIYCSGGTVKITNNTISGNSSTIDISGLGGGGICIDGGDVTVEHNKISGNSAYYGGGITCSKARNATISWNTIENNTASYGGGIICLIGSNASRFTISNNIIAHNSASISGGGCAAQGAPNKPGWDFFELINNTIVGNNAEVDGGGVYATYVECTTAVNNIIAFNSSGCYDEYGLLYLVNNCVYNPGGYDYSGETCDYYNPNDINVDPMLKDWTAGDYHLASNSPCIDKGTTREFNIPAFDIDSQPRFQANSIDIGVDETGPYEAYSYDIHKVKFVTDGTPVYLDNVVHTAFFMDCSYVESLDRCVGIRVEGVSSSSSRKVKVAGVIKTNSDGERYILASSIMPDGGDAYVQPVAMSNKAVGGGKLGLQEAVWGWNLKKDTDGKLQRVEGPATGLNNIGLLITICGKIDYDYDKYILDDGSGCPIECVFENRYYIDLGRYMGLTGISSCKREGDHLVPVIYVFDGYPYIYY